MRTRTAERTVLAAGLMLLAVWGPARFHRTIASRAAIARFRVEEAAPSGENLSISADPVKDSKVDFRFWSQSRVTASEDSLTREISAPLAILRIPKIHLEVPVFNGTDELTLNRGVGRIKGTAEVTEFGNLGIAKHRDGFSRGPKDIEPGDTLELNFPGRTDQYKVSRIQVVKPEDTSVLNLTPTPTLTLVTCFPFYYIGNAPEGYIVTASLQNSSQRDRDLSLKDPRQEDQQQGGQR